MGILAAFFFPVSYAFGDCVGTPITSLPITITSPGTYCIQGPMSTTGGITIKSDDVTLDGQHHLITITSDQYNWLSIGKDGPSEVEEPPLYRLKVRNLNVEAHHIDFFHFVAMSSLREGLFEGNTFKVTDGQGDNGDGSGARMLFALFQSHLNIIRNNIFILTMGVGDFYGWNVRNGSCGNQFINNTLVAYGPNAGSPAAMTSGTQTRGVHTNKDNLFIGNRMFSKDRVVKIQEGSGKLWFENNFIYAGSDTALGIGNVGADSVITVRNNTLISNGARSYGQQENEAYATEFTKNIFISNGSFAFDTHANPLVSDFNNIVRRDAGDLVWWASTGAKASLSAWQAASLNDAHSISSAAATVMTDLFENSNVDLNLNASTHEPLSLGDFRLKAGAARPIDGTTPVEIGSPGLNGVAKPIYCSVPIDGVIQPPKDPPPPIDPPPTLSTNENQANPSTSPTSDEASFTIANGCAASNASTAAWLFTSLLLMVFAMRRRTYATSNKPAND